MKREEYYNKSDKEKLPKRCPILSNCERFAQTILYLSETHKYGHGKTDEDKLKNAGYIDDNYIQHKISQKGTPFSFSKSENTCSIHEACPEVSLFCNSELFGFIPIKAVISGSWDNYWKEDEFGEDKQFKVYKTGHYSECAEFSSFAFNKQSIKQKQTIVPPRNYVYVMYNSLNGYYKIGRSINPKYREKTLQAQEPNVELIETWEAPREIETQLHQKFKSKRLRGEWFNLTMDDINKIYIFMKQNGY